VIQNHFFLAAFLLVFGFAAFLAAGFLAIGFLFPPAAGFADFLVADFLAAGFAGDLAGDDVAAGADVVAAGVVAAGVVAAGAVLATFGFLEALVALVFGALTVFGVFGLLFEALFFDSDLFCCLAIFYYYKIRLVISIIYNPLKNLI
jgi:hypothetical protein